MGNSILSNSSSAGNGSNVEHNSLQLIAGEEKRVSRTKVVKADRND